MARIVSFNVNGLRSRLHQLQALVDQYSPDIIGLQETKVSDAEFPREAIEAMGYHVDFCGQKGHYGVALLSKTRALTTNSGFPSDAEDAQRRLIHGQYKLNGTTLHVINGYFPQGESRQHPTKYPAKEQFYGDLLNYLNAQFTADDHVIVMGDMNVAPADIDVGIAPGNAKRWIATGKCAFLPEEREWLQNLSDWGLHDSFRTLNPTDNRYSWFDYRSRGFEQEPKRGLRIDLILTSAAALAKVSDAGIATSLRSFVKPSDHCPVWAELSL